MIGGSAASAVFVYEKYEIHENTDWFYGGTSSHGSLA